MRKAIFFLVIILLVSALANIAAQSGYKDYTWGMTVAQVKAKCPDIKLCDSSYWPQPSYAIMCLYNNEIDVIAPDPLENESRELLAFDSKKDNLKFYFIDKKLVAIELHFWKKNVLSDLMNQYKEVFASFSQDKTYQYNTASWYDNEGRIIVWDSPSYNMENVTYIDRNWLDSLMDKTMSLYRDKKAKDKPKLDLILLLSGYCDSFLIEKEKG